MSTKPSNKMQEAVISVGEEQGNFIGNRLLTEASNSRISEVSWRRQHVTRARKGDYGLDIWQRALE